MARIRSIKPAFFRSANVAELPSDACRLTWIGVWGYCDDEGRGADDSRLVKGEIWALHDRVTAKTVEAHLKALAAGDEPMICRYETAGRRYLHVINWHDHQKINRPQPSRFPPCPAHHRFTADSVNGNGTDTEPSLPEGKGMEGNREWNREVEGKGSELSSSSKLSLVAKPPDDDEPDIATQAIRLLAEQALAGTPSAVGNPTAWLAKTVEERTKRHATTITEALAAFTWTAEQLARHLEPEAFPKPRPEGYIPKCATCRDRRIVDCDEHNNPIFCPDCQPSKETA